MKKLLLAAVAVSAFMAATAVCAETVSGQVSKVDGNAVTIKTADGQKKTFTTNEKTSYRKKSTKKAKTPMNRKMMKKNMATASYQPMVDEDEWVEVVYDPTTQQAEGYVVDYITVYDD